MKLSEDRAFAVKTWLEQQSPSNFPDGRIKVFAHGQTEPLDAEHHRRRARQEPPRRDRPRHDRPRTDDWTARGRLACAFLPEPRRRPDRSRWASSLFWAGLALLAVGRRRRWQTLPGPVRGLAARSARCGGSTGMGPELFTTLRLILHALALTVVISLRCRTRR